MSLGERGNEEKRAVAAYCDTEERILEVPPPEGAPVRSTAAASHLDRNGGGLVMRCNNWRFGSETGGDAPPVS